jgi:hypothetical protein
MAGRKNDETYSDILESAQIIIQKFKETFFIAEFS